jgi:hypothetical protein
MPIGHDEWRQATSAASGQVRTDFGGFVANCPCDFRDCGTSLMAMDPI